MSIAFHITYLVSIFALAAYVGADWSKLFSNNDVYNPEDFFYYVKTKKGVTVPKANFLMYFVLSLYLPFFWFYGALVLLTQQWIVENVRSYLGIEIKPFFDVSENGACWIYGAVTCAGYFAGKALLYEFTSKVVIRHINSIDPMQHPKLDITFRKVFESSHERSQLL